MKHLASLIFACSLTACGTLTAVQTSSFNDKELIAQTTLASIRTNTLTVLNANKISVATAAGVQKTAKGFDLAIDTARDVFHTDCPVVSAAVGRQCSSSPGSNAQLDATIAGLAVLQSFLVKAQGGQP